MSKNRNSSDSDCDPDDPYNPEKEYVIEKVIDSKVIKGERFLKIKWLNYGPKFNTWEPCENIPRNIVDEYDEECAKKTARAKKRKSEIKKEAVVDGYDEECAKKSVRAKKRKSEIKKEVVEAKTIKVEEKTDQNESANVVRPKKATSKAKVNITTEIESFETLKNIIGIYDEGSDDRLGFKFIVEYKGGLGVFDREFANLNFPLKVIRFYETKLDFSTLSKDKK